MSIIQRIFGSEDDERHDLNEYDTDGDDVIVSAEPLEEDMFYARNIEGLDQQYTFDLIVDNTNDRVWVGRYNRHGNVVSDVCESQFTHEYESAPQTNNNFVKYTHKSLQDDTEVTVYPDAVRMFVKRTYRVTTLGDHIIKETEFDYADVTGLRCDRDINIDDEDIKDVVREYRSRLGCEQK